MLAAVLFAAHLTTVSFTHPCASAEEVLFALGQKLGMQLEPTGSVKKDYFLVRAIDKEPQEVLDHIASTLCASWTDRDGVRYLGRTHAQELELVDYARTAMREFAESYLASQPKPRPWTREDAIAFLRPFIKPDGTLEGVRVYQDLGAKGPYHDLLVEFARAVGADALSHLPERTLMKYEWQPTGTNKQIPSSFRPVAETIAKSVKTIGTALQELDEFVQLGFGDINPDAWSFTVSNLGRTIMVSVVNAGSNPSPFGNLPINLLTTPEQFAPYLPTDAAYTPSSLAKSYFDSLLRTATGPGNWQPSAENPDVVEWFQQGFPSDPLQLGAGEAILQALDHARLNAVAVLTDFIAPYGSWFPMAGQSLRSLLANLLNSNVVRIEGGWLLARHSVGLGSRERFDRSTLAAFSVQTMKEGWQHIEPLSDLASKCDGATALFSALRISEAINPGQFRYHMIGKERFDLLNIYAALPLGAKRSAKSGGAAWKLAEMPRPARERLIATLRNKEFVRVRPPQPYDLDWPSDFVWAHPGGNGPSVDLPPDAMVVVRLDSSARIAVPDKGGKGMYMAGLFTPEEAAARIVQNRTPEREEEFRHDFDFLAVVKAERLVITVTLPNGDAYRCGLIVDSQTPATKFSPYSALPGPEGDALREALRKLGG